MRRLQHKISLHFFYFATLQIKRTKTFWNVLSTNSKALISINIRKNELCLIVVYLIKSFTIQFNSSLSNFPLPDTDYQDLVSVEVYWVLNLDIIDQSFQTPQGKENWSFNFYLFQCCLHWTLWLVQEKDYIFIF